MRTLDEVIKAFECCEHGEPDSRCKDCPYNGIGSCCLERENDALYYLKGCQNSYEALNNHIERYQKAAKECEEILTDYVALKQYWAEQQANNPLTWDDLKQMKGKPVWIVRTEKYCVPHWAIIEDIIEWDLIHNSTLLLQPDDEELFLSDHTKTWQAYRKETI